MTLRSPRTDDLDYRSLADAYAYKDKAFFRFTPSSFKGLKAALGTEHTDWAKLLITDGFYQMVVASWTESHAEATVVSNVMADTFVTHSLGANPVRVSLAGQLYLTPDQDHRLDLVHLYHSALRGTALHRYHLLLEFFLKGTQMFLYPLDLAVSVSSSQEDFAQITMSAIASNYHVGGGIDAD